MLARSRLEELFDSATLKEAYVVRQLEDWLMNLNPSNFETVKKNLLSSIFVQNELRVRQLASHIIFAVSKRYMSIPLYSELTCVLYEARSESNALAAFHRAFFPIIIPKQVDSRTLYFLYFCAVGTLFTSEDIVAVIESSLAAQPDHISELLTLFCFFAPEVEMYKPDLFTVFIQAVIKESTDRYCGSYVKQFASEIDQLRANNWQLLKERRDAMKSGDEIIDSIFLDSLDDFQRVVTQAGDTFDWNQRINESIFSPPHMFAKSLIQFAARCGAVKCFRYLLLNGADRRGTVDSAIIGGNNAIVRILEQEKENFSGALRCAASNHRNEIFRWLEASIFPITTEDSDPNARDAMFGAAESCNIKLLLELLDRGVDVNMTTADGETVLYASVLESFVPSDGFKFLVQARLLDKNKKTMQGMSPLLQAVTLGIYDVVEYYVINSETDLRQENLIHTAALLGHADIMALLLGLKNINVNAKNRAGKTALEIAAEKGHYAIVNMLLEHPGIDKRQCKDLVPCCIERNYIHTAALLRNTRI